MKNVAVIDIGSNALRATIASITNSKRKILFEYRYPLRLGADVFHRKGRISSKKLTETENVFIELLHYFSGYKVTEVVAYATSAMRSAKNSKKLIENILKSTGIEIVPINGKIEAELIYKAVRAEVNFNGKKTLLVDIGGGSTEITLIKNKKVLGSFSFNLGTVRLLHFKNINAMEKEIEKQLKPIKQFLKRVPTQGIQFSIGTGGNLRRMGKLKKIVLDKNNINFFSQKDIEHIYYIISRYSLQRRIDELDMRPDRADVIVPASYIVFRLMQELNIQKMFVPDIGLKDGILLKLQE
ncbi:MAG: hypothetical protein JNM93_14090 [Bacteriovoracaceae bacterium]|nr:hypothetical protein [Bacteriovoracaceae bacterium]